jgi:hypothetical protein
VGLDLGIIVAGRGEGVGPLLTRCRPGRCSHDQSPLLALGASADSERSTRGRGIQCHPITNIRPNRAICGLYMSSGPLTRVYANRDIWASNA